MNCAWRHSHRFLIILGCFEGVLFIVCLEIVYRVLSCFFSKFFTLLAGELFIDSGLAHVHRIGVGLRSSEC